MQNYRIYSKRLAEFLVKNHLALKDKYLDIDRVDKYIYVFDDTPELHEYINKYDALKEEYFRTHVV